MCLEDRITVLEDIEAIKRLKYDYFFFCDNKQPEFIARCFASGPVTIDYGVVGIFENREALVDVFTRLACVEHIVEMHHAQNPRIDRVSDREAKAVWSLYFHRIDTQQNTVTQLGGYYEDEYRKIDQAWKISATKFVVTSTLVTELSEGLANVIFAGKQIPA